MEPIKPSLELVTPKSLLISSVAAGKIPWSMFIMRLVRNIIENMTRIYIPPPLLFSCIFWRCCLFRLLYYQTTYSSSSGLLRFFTLLTKGSLISFEITALSIIAFSGSSIHKLTIVFSFYFCR